MAHLSWEEYERAAALGRNSAAYKAARRKVLAPDPLWCGWCGGRIPKHVHYLDDLAPTADHIIEISDGGDPTAVSNLQPLHRLCNLEKERQRRARLEGRTARPRGRATYRHVSVSDTDRWVVEESP